MKKYDREKRKWVSEEEYEKTHQPRDKHFCRGKKPHDWVLVLPEFVEYNSNYNLDATVYYKTVSEINTFLIEKGKELQKLGIIDDLSFTRRGMLLYYVCSVCLKRKTERAKNI